MASFRARPKFNSPCPEYPDLLVPVFVRLSDTKDLSLEEELDRQVCLQGWVEKYQKS